MKTLHTIYNNFAKRNLSSLRLWLVMFLTLTVIINAQAETIASWGCISISANTNYKAIDGDANNKNVAQFSSSKAMTTSGTNAYYGSSAGGAVITFSNLDLSNYTDVMIYFYSRASQAGSFSLSYSTDGTSFSSGNSSGTLATNNTPTQYSIALPSNSEDITTLKLSHSKNSGSLYFGTVTITGTKKAAASYTITPQSNNTSYGTVSLSGTTITASPETGYRVSTTTPYTISPSASATVTQNGNTFTVTPSANTTITINFEALPKYTVTLKDDNSIRTQQSAGGSVDLPSRAGCTGYTFEGWTKSWTEEQEEWTTTAPTIIPAGSYTPTANENLYPVYTKTVTTEGTNEETKIVTLSTPTTTTSGYKEGTKTDSEGNTWSYYAAINNQSGTIYFGLNSNNLNYNIGSPVFDGKVSSVSFKARNGSSSESRKFLFCSTNTTAQPTKGDLAEVSIPKSQEFTNIYTADLSQSNISQFYIYAPEALGITAISVTYTTSTSGSTTSYISVPDCCTELAEVTNLVFSGITSNSITIGVPENYSDKENVSGYIFNLYNAKTGESAAKIGETNSKEGTSYTFTGLNKNTPYYFTVIAQGEGDYCNSAETSPRESSKTLAQYTVTLNPNGGTGDFSGWNNYTMTVDAGTEITLPELSKTGYDFDGWHDGGTTVTSPYTPTTDITLTAQWTAIKYSITYQETKGATNSNPTTYTIEDAITFAALTDLPKGYNFTGWDPASIAKGTTGNKTITAQWTEKALTRYRTDCDACIPLMGFASISGTYHFFPDETITLTVTPPADAVPYTYQWQKLVGSDWTDITDATATTYTKDAATIADAGRYRCVVSSEGYCDAIAEYNVKCLQLYVYYDNKSDVFNAPLNKANATTATISVDLQNANYKYYFKITDGCGNWYGRDGDIHSGWCTDVEMNADAYCGLKTTKFGTYVFNVNYSDLTKLFVSVLYPSAYQAADKVIYLDNDVLKWTNSNNAEGKNKIYYRIGRSDHNSKHAMTLVPGTANLYKVTTGEYDNFDVWHIANNGCWSDGNSIYKTNTGDGWAATQATAFETLPVTSDVVTVTPTDLRSKGGDENNKNCEFYNYDITEGMKTWKAQVLEPTNGTITVKYTHHDGTAVNNFTSGTRDLAHTCLLTITATPDAGYSLASLTVNDVPFTSGNVHTLTEDAVIKATFTINTHTVTWKLNGGNIGGDESDIVQTYQYGAAIESPEKPTYDCHEFVEWNSAYTVGMTMPDEDLVFTAKWNKLSYTITFKNYDGTVLQISTVECGETPSYTGAMPTREKDVMYDYDFAGWTPTVAEATGDQTYTATYNQTKRQYTVTWFVDGKQIDSKSVAAGDLATAPEVNPIPCGAVLAGWTDAENGVYEDGTSTLYEGAQPSIEITDNKTFYAVFADLEGAIPEIPTVIAYWENQKLTKDQGVSATIGAGTMTLNIGSTDLRTKAAFFGTISTQPIIELTNLDLTSHQDICLSFWTRGSVGGAFTIETNEKTILPCTDFPILCK